MYFILMFSGMTEILFSTILVLAIFLFFNEQYRLSAITISFIILVRSEGFVFLPLFFTGFAIKRKFNAIPYLGLGFLAFSIVGYFFYYHNFWWLITKLPYIGGQGGIYGSGPWYHFLTKMPEFLDYCILLFFLIGMATWIKKWIISSNKLTSEWFFSLLLIAGCFWIYLAAHSYVWWRGEMSLGLIRVMAGVSPLAGIIALSGWNQIAKSIHNKLIYYIFIIGTLILIIIPGINRYKITFAPDDRNVLINKVIDWLHDTGNFNHCLIVHDPYIAFAAKIDAWDQQHLQYGFSDVNKPEKGIADSSIFIWDAHYSQNEGRVSEKSILNNNNYELIGYFEPKIPFKVLNGYDYKIMVFRKLSTKTRDNYQILEELKYKSGKSKLVYSDFFDFEHTKKNSNQFIIQEDDSTQNKYYLMGDKNEFSPSVLITEHQTFISNQLEFGAELDLKSDEKLEPKDVLMVFSVEKNNKPYHYIGQDIVSQIKDATNWTHVRFKFFMPEDIKPGTNIKLYIWDVKKKSVKIDNLKIQVYSE